MAEIFNFTIIEKKRVIEVWATKNLNLDYKRQNDRKGQYRYGKKREKNEI